MNSEDTTDLPPAGSSVDKTMIGGVDEINEQLGRNTLYLRVVYPLGCSDRFELGSDPKIIGRGDDVDIILNDEKISREHCRVWAVDGGVVVEDLGSTNGTKIDHQPVKRQLLTMSARLQLGPFVLKIEYKDEQELKFDKELRRAATMDALTGIPNRQWMMQRAEDIFTLTRGSARQVSVVMLDIDHFKQVNDRFGHLGGDVVIKGVAQLIAAQLSGGQVCGRFGGEEFMLVLPDLDEAAAEKLCEALREAIEKAEFVWDERKIPVTVSLGLYSRAGRDIETLDKAIEYADKALYDAKQNGRNRVVRF